MDSLAQNASSPIVVDPLVRHLGCFLRATSSAMFQRSIIFCANGLDKFDESPVAFLSTTVALISPFQEPTLSPQASWLGTFALVPTPP